MDYFFQAVSAYAAQKINVFDLATIEDVKDFWNAMEWLENWQQENEEEEN